MTDVLLHNALPSAAYTNLDVRQGERFEHFRAHMAAVCDLRPPSGDRPDGYDIDSRKWLFDGAMLITGNYPEVNIARTWQHVQRDQLEHFEIRVRRGASQKFDTGARNGIAGGGQAVLVDCARPSASLWEPGRTVVMYMPREPLERLLPPHVDLHGLMLQGGASSLLVDHLMLLADLLPRMRTEEGQGLRASVLHLLAASIAPSADTLALARPSIESGVLRLARRLIEAQLQSPALGVDLLCKHFKVSRSSIYRLFEPLGGVANYIRERRLARIHELLVSAEQRQYLERLASDFGFANASHFSRAFRDQYGYSPRDARRRVAAEAAGPAPAARADPGGFLRWARTVNEALPRPA